MKIFIVPSWYPNKASAHAGVFIREQAEAIAVCRPGTQIIVSTWGHDFSLMSFRSPKKMIKKLFWWLFSKRNSYTLKSGVIEVFNPMLSWSERLPFSGIERIVSINRKNIISVFRKYGKPDIIHAHACYPGGYVASILSKEFGIPYILTEHMSPFPFSFLLKKGKLSPEVGLAYKNASKTIAVSSSLAQKIKDFDLSSPTVIPNLVNEDLFHPALHQSKKFVFFSLAVISHQKGIDHLLQAISLWAPDPQRFEFRIGGDGPLLNEYIQLAKKLGISDRVCWLGHTSRTSAVKQFQESNAFILPSRHETFGVVYAEALACGKPIIATRCGGPEDIVNNNNGILVQIGNISELSEAMRYIAEHSDEFNAQVIRDDFIERFSRKAVVDRIFRIYEEIIQGE